MSKLPLTFACGLYDRMLALNEQRQSLSFRIACGHVHQYPDPPHPAALLRPCGNQEAGQTDHRTHEYRCCA